MNKPSNYEEKTWEQRVQEIKTNERWRTAELTALLVGMVLISTPPTVYEKTCESIKNVLTGGNSVEQVLKDE